MKWSRGANNNNKKRWAFKQHHIQVWIMGSCSKAGNREIDREREIMPIKCDFTQISYLIWNAYQKRLYLNSIVCKLGMKWTIFMNEPHFVNETKLQEKSCLWIVSISTEQREEKKTHFFWNGMKNGERKMFVHGFEFMYSLPQTKFFFIVIFVGGNNAKTNCISPYRIHPGTCQWAIWKEPFKKCVHHLTYLWIL